MSLRHILNDEPSEPLQPPTQAVVSPATITNADSAPINQSAPASTSAPAPSRRRKSRNQETPAPPPPYPVNPPTQPFTYQPVPYPGAGGWNPHTGQWVQGDIFALGPGGNYYPDPADPRRDIFRNGMANGDGTPPIPKEPIVIEQPVRKRRRTNIHLDDVVEYLPNPQRVCATGLP